MTSAPQPPIIIVGMHRSGTSMVARALRGTGLFTGHRVEKNHEALFFQRINRWLFQLSGATWDHPHPVRLLASREEARGAATRQLERLVHAPRVSAYTGWLNWLRYRTPGRFPFPWGWKDPRNTFTLPFWTDLYPGARVIHVVRSGVDVAASLARRGELELANLGEKFSWKDFATDRQLPDTELSIPCLELEQGFRLWETYCAEAEEQLALLPDGQAMTLRYEELLTDPAEYLRLLSAFAGVSPGEGQLAAVASSLDTSRRSAWEREEELRAFHQAVSDSPTMKRYGY
jgi:hypothetical protein